jgi:hypothetical protein
MSYRFCPVIPLLILPVVSIEKSQVSAAHRLNGRTPLVGCPGVGAPRRGPHACRFARRPLHPDGRERAKTGPWRDEPRGEGDRALVEPPAEILPPYSDSAVIRA